MVNTDGSRSIAARQCTTKYKIKPINQFLRQTLGIQPGQRAPKDVEVEIWMGISVDEIYRQKDSREEWARNRYPLIELGLSRAQLQDWFSENYPGRYLPRSACIGCPYKSAGEWKWLQSNDPASFQDAVSVDWALRSVPTVRNAITKNGANAYLHKSRTPLGKVDFDLVTDYDEIMADECEGVCRV